MSELHLLLLRSTNEARRPQYRALFGSLLVLYVGPHAEGITAPLREGAGAGGGASKHVVVVHPDAASFLQHLAALHCLPDVLIFHHAAPCALLASAL